MSYATPQDMEKSFSVRDLVALTNEDASATTIDADKLQSQLDDATLLIDTYLESRFSLPFAPGRVPKVLRLICQDIAMYRLQSLRPLHDIEDARKRYEDQLKVLREIRDGTLTLGLAEDSKSPTIATPTVLTQGPGQRRNDPNDLSQVYDRHVMRVF